MMEAALVIGLAAASLVIALLAWRWPRAPKGDRTPPAATGAAARDISVTAVNTFPVYNQQDGSQKVGDWHVSTKITNVSDHRVLIETWGFRLGDPADDVNMFITRPIGTQPELPYWLEPGANISIPVHIDDIRHTHDNQGIKFSEMVAWAETGDGRRFYAESGLPVKEEND